MQVKNIQILTPLQEGMLFHTLKGDDKSAYFVQYSFSINGHIEQDILLKSLTVLTQRHEPLRTRFVAERTARPVQLVLENQEPELTVLDLKHLPAREQVTAAASFCETDKERYFELQTHPLFRTALLYHSDKTQIVISFHHLILDGWSFAIILNELFTLLNALNNGIPVNLKEPVPFQQVLSWLKQQPQKAASSFWKKHLSADNNFELTGLPAGFAPSGVNSKQLSVSQTFDEQLTANIQQIATSLQVSVNMVLYSIWGIVLAKYTGSEKVITGITVSGRQIPVPKVTDVVGMCINTIPFAFNTGKDTRIADYIKQVSADFIDSIPYHYCSLADIQNESGVNGALFNHIVVIEDYPFDKPDLTLNTPELEVALTDVFEETHYPLSVHISVGNKMLWRLAYKPNVYPAEIINQVLYHINLIINKIYQSIKSNSTIASIIITDEKTIDTILHNFNNTERLYPKQSTLLSLYYQQLATNPETYLSDERLHLTLPQLETQSNIIAHALQLEGVQKGNKVAVFAQPSVWLIACIMAIYKRGAVYVPIDVKHPASRINYIFNDCHINVALAYNITPLPALTVNYKVLNVEQLTSLPPDDNSFIEIPVADSDAYIIYTSGSTGVPKGVMVQHRAVVNLLFGMQQTFTLTPADCMLQKTTATFDVSVCELFYWLVSGCKTYFLPAGHETDPLLIGKTIVEQNITVVCFVPSLLNVFLDESDASHINNVASLRYIFSAGEALSMSTLKRFNALLNRQNNTQLVNLYGPTEATVYTTAYICPPFDHPVSYISIGKPLPNYKIYIVDEQQNFLPPWIEGEIYIGGKGVAKGYLNNNELTTVKFINDPFAPGQLMYRTGDIGIWNNDGQVIFRGRADDQVKLNGQRIEPGEIEAVMLSFTGIKEAVAVLNKDTNGNGTLAAFYTGKEANTNSLKTHLLQHLPAYMVPTHIVWMDALPRSVSGKINKAALKPDNQNLKSADYSALHHNAVQLQLLKLWNEVLDKTIHPDLDFFANGGHSLSAIRLIAAIRKSFNITLSIPDVFSNPTLALLATCIKNTGTGNKSMLTNAPAQRHYPLMPAQQSIYVLQQLPGIGSAYQMLAIIVLDQRPDNTRLLTALNNLINRHAALRTALISLSGGDVCQEIIDAQTAFNSFIEQGGIIWLTTNNVTDAWLQNRQIIDITKAPLFKAYIIEQNNGNLYFVLDVHHLISDEHSNNLLIKELLQLYTDTQQLTAIPYQYPDVAYWYNNHYLTDQQYQTDQQWWQQYLAGQPSSLELPLPNGRPAKLSFLGGVCEFALPWQLAKWVYQSAIGSSVTPFSVLFTVFQLLLSRYALQDDFLIGLPITNRGSDELNSMVGLLVNTLPFRCRIQHDDTFNTHLQQTGKQLVELMAHAWYPLADIMHNQQISRSNDRHPLFSVLFNYINHTDAGSSNTDAPVAADIISEAKFDLSIEIKEQNGQFNISFNYCSDVFNAEYINALYTHFIVLLKNISSNDNQPVKELDIVDFDETEQLMGFGAGSSYPAEFNTLQHILQAAYYYYTDLPAIVNPDATLSYLQLQCLTNGIVQKILQNITVEDDTVIAIYMHRNPLTLSAAHAVIMAGAAYLPLDPDLPAERIKFMLEDSGTSLILYQDEPPAETGNIPCCKIDYSLNIKYVEHRMAQPQDIAYIIYTSGSTGKPKGVMVEHRSIVNRLCWLQRHSPSLVTDTWLWKTTFTFDVSVGELFGWTLGGSKIHVLPAGHEKNPEVIINAISSFNITRIHFVASMLQIFIEYVQTFAKQQLLNSITTVLSSGESVSSNLIASFYQAIGTDKQLLIMYGPTEAAVEVSIINASEVQYGPVSIGKPSDNVDLYIVHPVTRKLQPQGIDGEILIGGVNVARGYKNRPALQHKHFGTDPFKPAQRVFYTNDMGCWMPDGTIQFKSRSDSQIKLNGYRIELQEIEMVLEQNAAVQKALVSIMETPAGNRELVAFVKTITNINEADLTTYLKLYLPAYMVPQQIITVNDFATNNSGKTNRAELQNIYMQRYQQQNVEVITVSNTEQQMLHIFHQVLGRDNILITDDFFAAGGHSILAIKLINRIQQQFNVEIHLPDVFSHTTARSLSALLITAREATITPIPELPKQEFYNLSPAQRRLWFLQQLNPTDVAYNMTYGFKITGTYHADVLIESFTTLVNRHEQLRASFIMHHDGPASQIADSIDTCQYLTVYTDRFVDDEQIVQIATKFCNRPFDLDKAPLLRVLVAQPNSGQFYVILNMHHIITDGWSMVILLNELTGIYQAKLNKEPLKLAPLRTSYTNIAQWMLNNAAGKDISQKTYWLNRIDQSLRPGKLPALPAGSANTGSYGNTLHFELQPETIQQIRTTARQWNCTENQIMLYSYAVLLANLSQCKNVVFGLSVSGRTHPDMEDVAGFFVNMLPVPVYIDDTQTVKRYFDHFTSLLIQDMEHQALPFDELSVLMQHEKGIKLAELIRTRFVYNHFSDDHEPAQSSMEVQELNIEMQGSKFDLSLTVQPHNNGLTLNAEYKTEVYDARMVSSYIQQWESLTVNLCRAPEQPLSNFFQLQPVEASQVRKQSYQLLKNLQQLN